ncbi:hypothetical protein F511_43695 [Dorcoceras hygrometricum]|uniref:Retrotransposon gag domain-containing protein n=1 Tax=Dorcoceras hygrometricum TaxID=472368 RepID=A0A2Z7DG64_9LAMI|nr:hypothetical protein F511_43695 [Dorcoceras hygrometricum]
MPPKRTRAQGTGDTSNTKRLSQGSENPSLTAAQIAQLVAATVEQILTNRHVSRPPPDQQSEEIRKLREEVARMRKERSSAPPPLPPREVPFSAEVLAAKLPQHFKFPDVGEYDGMGDPEEHLSRFENFALLYQYDDPIKCRVFLTTLVRYAQQWFNRLPTGSIKSFKDFSQVFLLQFASSKKQPMTTLNLFTL